MCAAPPRYSSESNARRVDEVSIDTSTPSYSSEPRHGEQRLQHNPAPSHRGAPTGTYAKSNGLVTVLLTGQEEGVEVPTYGRSGIIRGEVVIREEDLAKVGAVHIKLNGNLELTIAEGGTSNTHILSISETIWTSNHELQICPEILPFECVLPSTYRDHQRLRQMPPSFNFSSPGVPGLFVKCVYTLEVEVRKKRALAFWKRRKNLAIIMEYAPQTRPPRPILSSDLGLLDTIKPSPEEWRQVITKMDARPASGFKPIQCHMFIPSMQIYGISDTIAFHIQLTGPRTSLKALTYRPAIRDKNKPFIHVFLLRQIMVEVYGQKAWRDCVIGEGLLKQLPCIADSMYDRSEPESETLDWEGEVRCADGVYAGGFNIGNLAIKDFIVLALYPPRPTVNPLVELHHAHPIRLVTDPWADLPVPGVSEEIL